MSIAGVFYGLSGNLVGISITHCKTEEEELYSPSFSSYLHPQALHAVAQFPTILQRLSARCLFIACLSDIDTCFLYLTPTTWLSALFSTSYFGRSRHTYSSQQQALHVSHWPSAFMNVEAFLCFGLSFSLQNHINLLFIQHFPCCYAIISKILRNFAVVNISVI